MLAGSKKGLKCYFLLRTRVQEKAIYPKLKPLLEITSGCKTTYKARKKSFIPTERHILWYCRYLSYKKKIATEAEIYI